MQAGCAGAADRRMREGMSKTVYQVAQLPAAPSALYSMYLDPEQHAAFTGGGAVQITPIPGTDWSAFDGRIHGRSEQYHRDANCFHSRGQQHDRIE